MPLTLSEQVRELQEVLASIHVASRGLSEALAALASSDAAHGSLLAPHLAGIEHALAASERAMDRWHFLGNERGRED